MASTTRSPRTGWRTPRRGLDTLHASLSNTIVGREEYLHKIYGITFGEDPRQGFFEGNTFYHPDMRFQLQYPEGWKTQNTPSAVVAVSPGEDAILQLALAGDTPPRDAASKFLSQEGITAGRASSSSINGNQAATSYFQAQTEQGVIEGIISFISYGGRRSRCWAIHRRGTSTRTTARSGRRSTASISSVTRPRSR